MVIVRLVETYSPGRGFYLVAAVAGLTDVDAITLSMAQYARNGSLAIAVQSITIAALTNTLVKTVMVAALGTPQLRRPVLVAAALVLAAGGGALLLL